MKALTIRQPWLWAILNAGKRHENRKWRSDFRGTIALHASKGITSLEWAEAGMEIRKITEERYFPPRKQDLDLGAILGVATIVDWVDHSKSPWFFGPYALVLDDVRVLRTPIPCSGALGFWTVPEIFERAINTQMMRGPSPLEALFKLERQ